MRCDILWDSLTDQAWDDAFAGIKRANLLQCRDYAEALSSVYGHKARRGLVQIGGQDAGLVQIMEHRAMGGLFQAVMLDRGPLWFAGFGGAEHVGAFFERFNDTYPRRFGRKRRVIPESLYEPGAGYRKTAMQNYETIWLDLQKPEAELRASLDKKWRNALAKGEKTDPVLEWGRTTEHMDWLLAHHMAHRKKHGYGGASPELIRAMGRIFSAKDHMLPGRILYMGKPVAGILVFMHGRSATYQIGWNGEIGRQQNAHHVLLWSAALELKARGFNSFDLGGVNEKDAKHVKKFKQGLGGDPVTLSGCYR